MYDFLNKFQILRFKNYKVDVDAIKNQYLNEILPKYKPHWKNTLNERIDTLPYEIAIKKYNHGGWSILSEDGSIKSGWNDKCENEWDHIKESPLCVGPIKKLKDDIINMGFKITRMRISCVFPNNHVKAHVDGIGTMFRFQIPIITNKKIFFYNDDLIKHIPNGYIYLINVNAPHGILNLSNFDRIHIFMTVAGSTILQRINEFEEIG